MSVFGLTVYILSSQCARAFVQMDIYLLEERSRSVQCNWISFQDVTYLSDERLFEFKLIKFITF